MLERTGSINWNSFSKRKALIRYEKNARERIANFIDCDPKEKARYEYINEKMAEEKRLIKLAVSGDELAVMTLQKDVFPFLNFYALKLVEEIQNIDLENASEESLIIFKKKFELLVGNNIDDIFYRSFIDAIQLPNYNIKNPFLGAVIYHLRKNIKIELGLDPNEIVNFLEALKEFNEVERLEIPKKMHF